jgi:hypothetical protein
MNVMLPACTSVREIWYMSLHLMPFSDYDFRENQHTESHTPLRDVDKFLFTFIGQFG